MFIHQNISAIHASTKVKYSSYLLALYLIFLPISTALSGLMGSPSLQNYVAILYILLATAESLVSKKIIIRKNLCPVYAYFLYTLVTALWNSKLVFDWYFFQFVITTFLILCITTKTYTEKEYVIFKKSIYLSAFVVIIVSLLNISTAFSYRLTITVTSAMDPNDFACGLGIIIALCLSELLNEKKKILNYLIVLTMIGIIFLCGSRGAMLMAISMIMIWILYTSGTKKMKVILAAAFGACFIYIFATDNTTDFLLNRFTISNILEGEGSGRYRIWMAAWDRFLDSNILQMLFGCGHGSFKQAVNYIAMGHANAYASHNMFINALIEGGGVGFLLLINCLLTMLNIVKKNIFGVLLIIGFIIEGLTLDAQVYRTFAMTISLAYIWKYKPNNKSSNLDIKRPNTRHIQ